MLLTDVVPGVLPPVVITFVVVVDATPVVLLVGCNVTELVVVVGTPEKLLVVLGLDIVLETLG